MQTNIRTNQNIIPQNIYWFEKKKKTEFAI